MLLIRDPTLAIPPKKNEYSKFLILFEFLFYDMQSNSESSVVLANIKERLQDTAITSYFTFKKGNSSPFNWTNDEFEAMCKLENENYLVIQKGNKGNTIDILGKDSYLKWVETLLKDSSKFRNILVASDKYLNCMINSGKIESLICQKNSKKMKRPIINWGLLSKFMDQVNCVNLFKKLDCHYSETIFSAIGTPTYKLGKMLVPFSVWYNTEWFYC